MAAATAAPPKAEPAVSQTATCATVLDFDARDVDSHTQARTRQLLQRVLAAHGPAGLARALHVVAPRATQLKHRVTCVTCRSRLDALTASLATATASAATAAGDDAAACSLAPPEGPALLTAWLAADAGRGLAPAPRALRDLTALAAFLGSFASNAPGAGGAGGVDEVPEDTGRKGKSSAVVRCAHHAPRPAAIKGAGVAAAPPGGVSAVPPVNLSIAPGRERAVALLRSGTSDAEWRQLGTVDIDDAMCDLFAFLGERGLCSTCVDAVTGSLLDVQQAITGTSVCTCSRCSGRCAEKPKVIPEPLRLTAGPRVPGEPPEQIRVQGRLRAICGIYRLQPQCFNGRPVYKKDRIEAHLLHTSLNDWMISGRADAGGARCEGWAYVTDSAKTPDEIRGVWKVSGPRGWEEDRSLVATAFEDLPEQMRVPIADSSVIAKGLAANERGVFIVRLSDPEVLKDVLVAPEEPQPVGVRPSVCAHISTPEAAQKELRLWLQWLIRERLDGQRRRILAQAQVGASLCHLFACAALQQLEEVAETPAAGERRKGKKVKKGKLSIQNDCADIDAATMAIDDSPERCAAASEALHAADPFNYSLVDTNDGSGSASVPSSSPTRDTTNCTAGGDISGDSVESTSTRASSEEPPDARSAHLATGARRLMEQMGWRPEVDRLSALDGAEVAAWHEQHPCYRQAIDEERQKLRTQFQQWLAIPRQVV